ncbi:acyltransferase family protein [Bifidobacterium thermacidophilum]|uniref:acyltransferase family protein n=1 Tax=Bifidobacterium thermacidophilum TaxID=246618 RepID=UPI0004954555
MTAMKKRIEWIDIAKGIGITLVSFGHLRNGDGQSVWLPALDSLIAAIYLFHMPLFFLLGGITFSMRGGYGNSSGGKLRRSSFPTTFSHSTFLLNLSLSC